MDNNKIVSYSTLNPNNINPLDYTNTLVAEAFRVGLLNEAQISSLRGELMGALADVINLFTKSASSSVKADTARELVASMQYNIDTHLLTLGSHEAALRELLDRKPYELYGKGYLINKHRYEQAKHLYGSVRYNRLKNASEAYNKTLDKYFRYYLTHYDPRFSSHLKIYLTLIEYDISGAYHMDEAIKVLEKLIEISRGAPSDVMVEAEQGSESHGAKE